MSRYQLTTSLRLPRAVPQVFEFFADAGNLDALTPPWLRFRILTPLPIAMREGALIAYRLRLRGIPIRWLTEITVWEPPSRFVDTQRRGPYLEWVHEHRFTEEEGGTRVDDVVLYRVPGGALAHRLCVAHELRRIFGFRQRALLDAFGLPETQPGPVLITAAPSNPR